MQTNSSGESMVQVPLFLHGELSQGSTSTSQSMPVYSTGHVQTNSSGESMVQVPLFSHGELSQGSTSTSQSMPV